MNDSFKCTIARLGFLCWIYTVRNIPNDNSIRMEQSGAAFTKRGARRAAEKTARGWNKKDESVEA